MVLGREHRHDLLQAGLATSEVERELVADPAVLLEEADLGVRRLAVHECPGPSGECDARM